MTLPLEGPNWMVLMIPPVTIGKQIAGTVTCVGDARQYLLSAIVGRAILHQPSRKVVFENVAVVPRKAYVLLSSLRNAGDFVRGGVIAECDLTAHRVRDRVNFL